MSFHVMLWPYVHMGRNLFRHIGFRLFSLSNYNRGAGCSCLLGVFLLHFVLLKLKSELAP